MSIDWIQKRKINPKEMGNRGYIPTKKNPSGILMYESCVERDLFLKGIQDLHVIRIQHQPISIVYIDKSQNRRIYTPDAYLEFVDGKKLLVEVKLESEVDQNKEKYKERWDAASKWAEEHDTTFHVLTERHIRTPRLFNIWFTLGASKCIHNEDYMKSLNLLIPNEGID